MLLEAQSRRVTSEDLDNLMEFDHVIRVHADGTVSEPADVWAPDLNDGALGEYSHIAGQPTGWRLLHGYSGQCGYSGPIMHDSEFIGGRMARDILDEPGLYVAVANSTSEVPDGCYDCEHHDEGGPCDVHGIDGWAVAWIPEGDLMAERDRDPSGGVAEVFEGYDVVPIGHCCCTKSGVHVMSDDRVCDACGEAYQLGVVLP